MRYWCQTREPLLPWWRHQMETFSAPLAICAEIHRSPVNSSHKGQWHGALLFSLICVWIKGWVNNREAGDLRRHRAHYDVTVMTTIVWRLCTHRWTAMVAHACIGPWRCLTLDFKLDCLKCPLYISETEMSTIWGTFCYWQEVVKRHWCYKW